MNLKKYNKRVKDDVNNVETKFVLDKNGQKISKEEILEEASRVVFNDDPEWDETWKMFKHPAVEKRAKRDGTPWFFCYQKADGEFFWPGDEVELYAEDWYRVNPDTLEE
jgi:hypothetical protein